MTLAIQTYRAFARHHLLTPEKIVKAGQNYLVHTIMREGHYVRYDERKSAQIIRDCEKLLEEYGGSLRRLHDESTDSRELERRLTDFYGIGPVTANIFLRELRPFWQKANPKPLEQVVARAKKKHISLRNVPLKSIQFTRLEAKLVRELRAEGEMRKMRKPGGLRIVAN